MAIVIVDVLERLHPDLSKLDRAAVRDRQCRPSLAMLTWGICPPDLARRHEPARTFLNLSRIIWFCVFDLGGHLSFMQVLYQTELRAAAA
jgi:hypothetical protein